MVPSAVGIMRLPTGNDREFCNWESFSDWNIAEIVFATK